MEQAQSPSILKRAAALVVLLIAGWFLLKAVIGFVTWLATTAIVIVAIIAVIWAIRVL